MAFLLLLPLLLVPAAEIAVFIQVGHLIGLWPTLLGIIGTGVLGAYLMRAQGLGTLRRARAALDRRELPVKELFDGVCILIGGVLLLTPGFLTDALGLLFLLPPVRAVFRLLLLRRLAVQGAARMRPSAGPPPGHGDGYRGRDPSRNPWGAAPVIDAEFEEIDRPERPSGQGGGRDPESLGGRG